jgi:hypothetical protein
MKFRPALGMLVFWLVFLAVGGLYGGIAMLLDPMVVNELALLGLALWPSIQQMYRKEKP